MKHIQKRSIALTMIVCMVFAVVVSDHKVDRVTADISTHVAGESVTVTDSAYGANGSDMLDDTKAIQKALNLRKNSKDTSILTVKIPAGTYYISQQLHIYSNTTLSLDKDAIIVRSDDTKRMLIGGFTNSTIGGYGQLENVTITGGTWDGNNQDSDHAVNLMYMWHGRNVHIYNTTIREVCGSHFIELAAIKNARIENVTFQDFVYYTGEGYQYIYNNISTSDDVSGTKEPIVKRVSIRSEAIQLEYPGPDNSKTALPYDNTPCRNIIVTGCTFQNCLSGVGNHHPEISTPNIIISNNTFKNMGASCVNLSSMTGVEVSGNTATNVRAFLYSTGETEAEITNNTITYGFESVDPEIEQDMFYIVDNTDIKINDNKIYGCGKRAIFDAGGSTISITNNLIDLSSIRAPGRNAVQLGAKKGSNVTVDKNTIIKSDMSGIWISDSSGSITNNTISDSISEGGSGIRVLNNSKLNISGNQISNVAAAGIRILNNQKNVITVSSNIITNPGTQGLNIENSSVTASGNTISSSRGNGIKATNGSKLTASENTITSSAGNGINLSDSSLVASNNTITDSVSNSISLNAATSGTIKNNIIKNGSASGVRLFNCTAKSITVSDNTITNPGLQGISAEDSSLTASNNTITSPVENGMFLTNTSGNITKNTISGAKKQGIAIVGSTSLTVSGNTISNGTRNGIYMETSIVTLSDNTISESRLNGIRIVSNSNAMVTGNQISDSKAHGFGVEGSTVKASKNVIRESAVYGIYLNGAVFTVTENTIQDSGTNSIRIEDKAGSSSGSVTENVLGAQQFSNKSTGKVIVKNNCFFVDTPALSSVENVNTGVKITWKEVTGAVKYRVYYKIGEGGWKKIADTTSTSYTWTDVQSGINYTFTVRCMNNAGTLFASNYDKLGKSITYVATPKLSNAERVSDGVKIAWDKVTGAAKYRVYYKTGTGNWTKIADTTSTSYTWKEAKKGTTYTFTVRCISSDGKSFTSSYDRTGKTITY